MFLDTFQNLGDDTFGTFSDTLYHYTSGSDSKGTFGNTSTYIDEDTTGASDTYCTFDNKHGGTHQTNLQNKRLFHRAALRGVPQLRLR